MKKGISNIGSFVLNGYTVEEIKQLIPDFQPTREYFVKSGYAKSTAVRYIRMLELNTHKKEVLKNTFITSDSANFNNILVDTCALGFKDTIDIIEYAKEVTFIFSTLEEMDRKRQTLKDISSNQELYLARNIRFYLQEILLKKDKYLLSRFNGMKKENYPDNILLQYLMILPKKIRPTLLTVDKNVAVKAESLDLDYILFIPSLKNNETVPNVQFETTESVKVDNNNSIVSTQECNDNPEQDVKIIECEPEPAKSDSPDGSFIKKYQYGIQVLHTQQELYLTYRGNSRLFIMYQNGKTVEYPYNSTGIRVSEGDKFSLHIKRKKSICRYTEKIE